MLPAQISALLAPFLPVPLPDLQLSQLSSYLDLLLRWNARINLTAVRDPEQIVQRHFGESFFAAARLFPVDRQQGCLVDLGSGAGFPGLPIKIFASALRVTLIESHKRKATFLREVARALQLRNLDVFSGRAERFPAPPPPLTVTLRAVERFDAILPVAASLLATSHTRSPQPDARDLPAAAHNSRLALLIGHSQIPRARQILPHFSWLPPLPIPLSASRVLLIGSPQAIPL